MYFYVLITNMQKLSSLTILIGQLAILLVKIEGTGINDGG